MTSFAYEGFQSVEKRLKALDDDASHVVVWDRTHHDKAELIGRFNLTVDDAAPYFDSEDDEVGVDFDSEWDEVPRAVLNRAAIRWVRDVVENHLVGGDWARFRLRVYGPKGHKSVLSATFVVRNGNAPKPEAAPARPLRGEIPEPSFAEDVVNPGMRALGDYYTQWGKIVLGSMQQLQDLKDEQVQSLREELKECRTQVDLLMSQVLEQKMDEIKAEHERLAASQAGDRRHELAKEAIGQLGKLGQVMLAAQAGAPPEMVGLMDTLGESPELMGALQDPAVQELMRQPENLAKLAEMLQSAGQHAQAQGAGVAPPTMAPMATPPPVPPMAPIAVPPVPPMTPMATPPPVPPMAPAPSVSPVRATHGARPAPAAHPPRRPSPSAPPTPSAPPDGALPPVAARPKPPEPREQPAEPEPSPAAGPSSASTPPRRAPSGAFAGLTGGTPRTPAMTTEPDPADPDVDLPRRLSRQQRRAAARAARRPGRKRMSRRERRAQRAKDRSAPAPAPTSETPDSTAPDRDV